MPTPPRDGLRAAGRLLLTEDAPSYGVLAGLRALRTAGHEVWLAVGERPGYGARSRARAGLVRIPDPARQPAAYVDVLAAAAQRLRVAAVLPGTDLALSALAGRTSAFGDVPVGVCDPETVALAGDKARLGELAAGAGLATPPTRAIRRGDPAGWRDADLPGVVKVPAAAGARIDGAPVRRVATHGELEAALAAAPGGELLLQPFLAGRLRAVAGVAWRGDVITTVHQVAERIYPPACGISAYARTVPVDAELDRGVVRLVQAVGWSGIFQAQFLEVDGEPLLIDFNPRMYGSLALAVAAGANLPAMWAQLLAGSRPAPVRYEVGVRFRSEERDAGALATAAARRDWATLRAGLRPHPRTIHAVFSLRDPLPALRVLSRLARAPALARRA